MKSKKFDATNLSTKSGVYWFKDDNNSILYIGKAKNIKNRIEEYLNGSINSYKTPILMEKAASLEYQVCRNEKESLLLEQEMIKKHKPPYNILLLDDKKYPYIVIKLSSNKLEFKTSFFYKKESKAFYFGPLPPNYGYKTIKNFLIRECLYENGLPIQKNKDPEFWRKKFDYAKKILSSSNEEIISRLKNQMEEASINQQYELAKEFRDVIQYLSKNQDQSITFNEYKDFDVIAFCEQQDFLMVIVHNFKNGSFFMQEEFIFEISISLYESVISFINYFYSIRNESNFIVTNIDINEEDLIIDKKVLVPKKGKYHHALINALSNIEVNKELKITSFKNKVNANKIIKNFMLEIFNKQINDFIMIDNSNEANKDVVSAIIYYKNYLPFPKNYRKYSIENIERESDVEYIKQGLTKYFSNGEEIPDLVIVDGSIQQINEAKKILREFNINSKLLGVVKDNKHRTSHLLTSEGQEIYLDNRDIYNFFSKIQIEVDNLAKSFHSKKKINSTLEGFLSKIKGIGPVTEEKLLNHFKTYSNIYNATEEQLLEVIPKSIALKIMRKLGKIR